MVSFCIGIMIFVFLRANWLGHKEGISGWGYSGFLLGTFVGALVFLAPYAGVWNIRDVWLLPLAVVGSWVKAWMPFGLIGLAFALVINRAKCRQVVLLGCTEHAPAEVVPNSTPGPKFASRKELIAMTAMSSFGIFVWIFQFYFMQDMQQHMYEAPATPSEYLNPYPAPR